MVVRGRGRGRGGGGRAALSFTFDVKALIGDDIVSFFKRSNEHTERKPEPLFLPLHIKPTEVPERHADLESAETRRRMMQRRHLNFIRNTKKKQAKQENSQHRSDGLGNTTAMTRLGKIKKDPRRTLMKHPCLSGRVFMHCHTSHKKKAKSSSKKVQDRSLEDLEKEALKGEKDENQATEREEEEDEEKGEKEKEPKPKKHETDDEDDDDEGIEIDDEEVGEEEQITDYISSYFDNGETYLDDDDDKMDDHLAW